MNPSFFYLAKRVIGLSDWGRLSVQSEVFNEGRPEQRDGKVSDRAVGRG